MAILETACPACAAPLRLPPEFAGRQGVCPRCRETIVVPGPGAPVPAAEARAPGGEATAPGGEATAPGGGGAPSAPDRPCPACGEPIKVAAKKCRHCGEFLDAALRAARRGQEDASHPPVPVVLKVWGALVMGLAGLGAASQVLQMASLLLVLGAGPGAGFLGAMTVATAIMLGVFALFGRLGLGLFRGRRMAVVGLGVFCALGLLGGGLVLLDRGGTVPGLVILGVVLALHGPPLVVGALRWQTLR